MPASPLPAPRCWAYLSGAAAAAVGCLLDFQPAPALLVIYALLYPQLTAQLSDQQARRHEAILIGVDALHTGIAAVIMAYSSVPSLVNLLILCFAAQLSGGLRRLTLALGLALAALLLGAALLQPQPHLATPAPVALAALLGALPCLLLFAARLRQRMQRLAQTHQALQREQHKSTQLEANLARYLSPQLWDSLFQGRPSVLVPQRKKLTVFFSDIKGFTELSEELEAESLTELLNRYLEDMSEIALRHGGTIDKFVGDSVMVFFGDPGSQGVKRDALAAASMAIAMRKHMKSLRQQWRSRGILQPLEIRMGLNTGYCTVGSFGASARMDYTVIGREVNLASRLEQAASPGEILISHETYSQIKDTILCSDKGKVMVKGSARPVQVYQIVDFRRALGRENGFIEHELPGFSLYLDTERVADEDQARVIEALQQAAQSLSDRVS